MERENDLFEQPSKVQNMNFMFDDDMTSDTQDLGSSPVTPASRRTRQVSSNGASVRRGQRVERSARNSSSQRSRSAQAPSSRSTSDRIQRVLDETTTIPAEQTEKAAADSSSLQSEFATPYRQAQARPTRKVSESAKTEGIRPRQTRPQQARKARPQQAQPKTAQPKVAQPRDAQPKQARPQKVRPQQIPRRTSSGQGQQARTRSASGNYDDNRRVTRSTAASASRGGNRKGGKKKGLTKFKKFLIIYSAILLVILVAGLIIFGSFMRSLEKSQPSVIASEIAETFSSGGASNYLTDNSDMISCFGEPTDLITQTADKANAAEQISYIENKDYRADAPSYNITADGATIAKVTLEKAGSGSFGLSKWKLASIDIAEYVDTESFEFLAPEGATITINGVELDDKYLTGEEGIPEQLKIASKYVTIPSYKTYKVAGIAGTPDISVKDANGNDMALTITDDKYVAGTTTSQEFISSVSGLVDGALEAWALHFINMGGGLGAYMIEGSDWYTYIFGGPDMDPILTSLYEFESIANYEFTEKSESNYIKYTDDCFTVDVNYKMRIDFNTDQMSDNNQQLNATWVFITQNNGQDWYLVDCIYK